MATGFESEYQPVDFFGEVDKRMVLHNFSN